MRVNALTDVGRVRTENQDNYRVGVLPYGTVWAVVCDGMGGGYDGSLASTIAVDTISKMIMDELREDFSSDEVQDVMMRSINIANDNVYEKSGKGQHIMGTTVVCCILHKQVLHIAHVGDSRAYLFASGALSVVTHDHSVVQELIDKGQITEEESLIHPEKNVITRALGVDANVDTEYTHRILDYPAVLLVCTDGLTNMVPNNVIAEFLSENNFYGLAKDLVAEALMCGGADNITVVLLENEEEDEHAG